MNKKFKELVEGKEQRELIDVLLSLKREHMNLRIKKVSPIEGFNPSVIKVCRKNIARIKTRFNQLKKEGK